MKNIKLKIKIILKTWQTSSRFVPKRYNLEANLKLLRRSFQKWMQTKFLDAFRYYHNNLLFYFHFRIFIFWGKANLCKNVIKTFRHTFPIFLKELKFFVFSKHCKSSEKCILIICKDELRYLVCILWFFWNFQPRY